ncbi:MAG: 7-carboxy-7-deazaguanine synthase QueE [Elusimicrobiales bacterium]|nr:7-carboxy-7-deazaguanine synthase QueE [Elusimicrobiales bacterium]
MNKIPISEIFVSYQGEGILIGERHLFIRFKGCNIKCSYCDEDKEEAYLMSLEDVVKAIYESYEKTKFKTISFTGGEPLLYFDFIKKITEILSNKFNYLLETNAICVDEFKKVVNKIDIVSADIKLPQYCNNFEYWDEHKYFLNLAKNNKLYVKVVFDDNVKISDFEKAVKCVGEVDRNIPFFIQPETNSFMNKKYLDLVDLLYNKAIQILNNVRFLPQLHKYVGYK